MKKTWSRVLATVLVLAMVLCMPGFAASVADTTDFESDRATSADELTDADLPELLSASGNHYPIVLVHGLFGWGGTEVLGLNYWGGFSSLRDILNNAGYEVYTPSIGPVASNWDRACELYAYLVGGTVDYGAYHSATNGHARYGRTFPGVLPELNNPDSELKVHLVGHSMGGETILGILEAAPWTHEDVHTLILQPQTKIDLLRCWLCGHGYRFLSETLVRDKEQLYVVFRVRAGMGQELSEADALTGLLLRNDPLYGEYLSQHLIKLNRARDGLAVSSLADKEARIAHLENLIEEIERRKGEWEHGNGT